MSGTSLDGLDIALCEVSGHDLSTSLSVIRFTSINYTTDFLSIVRPIFSNPNATLDKITHANAWIAREQARMVNAVLQEWDIDSVDVDILASHGQTIFHSPNSIVLANGSKQILASSTLQICDGDHLAYLTQILTVSDFRQKHIAALGEGAPLVPYADFLLFSNPQENRILVNIGGIANYTYIPANGTFNEVNSADTGPGNTLMDAVIQYIKELSTIAGLLKYTPPIFKSYDVNGEFAGQGSVDLELLDIMQKNYCGGNKSTGQETFNIEFVCHALYEIMQGRSVDKQNDYNKASFIWYINKSEQAFYDLMATLNLFTAKTIANAIEGLSISSQQAKASFVYISGGGVHNKVLMAYIREYTAPLVVKASEELGINPDAKEAALFAVLANQALFGSSRIFENNNDVPATSFGKISLP